MSRDYYVYRVYDVEDQLLYIGVTGDMKRRRWEHERRAWWRREAHRWEVDGPFDKIHAHQVETAAIRAEDPIHNVWRYKTGLYATPLRDHTRQYGRGERA